MKKKKKNIKVNVFVAEDGTEFDNETECQEYEKGLTNLYKETIEMLENYGKHIDDIEFIVCGEYIIPVDDFIKTAKEIWYYSSYGSAEIHEGLKIVGKDWWLERAEYDGSEWWEFKSIPIKSEYKEKALTLQEIKKLIN